MHAQAEFKVKSAIYVQWNCIGGELIPESSCSLATWKIAMVNGLARVVRGRGIVVRVDGGCFYLFLFFIFSFALPYVFISIICEQTLNNPFFNIGSIHFYSQNNLPLTSNNSSGKVIAWFWLGCGDLPIQPQESKRSGTDVGWGRLVHDRHSNSSQRCSVQLRSELWTGQSGSSTSTLV